MGFFVVVLFFVWGGGGWGGIFLQLMVIPRGEEVEYCTFTSVDFHSHTNFLLPQSRSYPNVSSDQQIGNSSDLGCNRVRVAYKFLHRESTSCIISLGSCTTAPFNNANSAKSMVSFFPAVNHLSGRLRKQKFTSTGSKVTSVGCDW